MLDMGQLISSALANGVGRHNVDYQEASISFILGAEATSL